MSWAWQNWLMRTSGRRSISEYCTWFDTMRMPCSTMMLQMLGIEVGQGQMADFALVPQLGQMGECLKIVGIAVIPPVELQQVEACRRPCAAARPGCSPRRFDASCAPAPAPTW